MNIKKLLRRLGRILLVLLLITVSLFTTVDWTPYQQMPYYQETKSNISALKDVLDGNGIDTVRVGWGKSNITPPDGGVLIAYGFRGDYESVHDSAYVKVFTFSSGKRTVALLAFDLWIIHPGLAKTIRSSLLNTYPDLDYVYFSATHTHNGFGGWSTGLAGKLMAGGYDEQVIAHLTESVSTAVKAALNTAKKAKIGFGRFDAGKFVRNRLDRKNGLVDPWIRVLKIEQEAGKTALFYTYSAHSTYLDKKIKVLSSDYSGALSAKLESLDSLNIDFAAFSAGTMGSHSPLKKASTLESMDQYAAHLADILAAGIPQIKTEYVEELKAFEVPIALREPHIRISDNWRLRPWVFKTVFGENPASISCVKLGKTVLIGTPCELSGEFNPLFSPVAGKKGLDLMVTTFNGAYIGYVTPDKYYDKKHFETREMNWYGPYNGAYFVELISTIVEKL